MHVGDCLEVMRSFAAESVDSIVTDPPYGIGFMGKAWDGKDIADRLMKRRSMPSHAPGSGPNGGHKSAAAAAGRYDLSPKAMRAFQEFSSNWAREALRVAKPGAHCVAFASPRTFHRMVCGLEEAGWEIRDTLMWVFGSGFPKSHNGAWGGTALKPAWEPIVLARKPLIGTVAANYEMHGTGALNIDGCRVVHDEVLREPKSDPSSRRGVVGRAFQAAGSAERNQEAQRASIERANTIGRWPANLIHDGSDEVVALFPRKAGARAPVQRRNADKFRSAYGTFAGDFDEQGSTFHGDSGGAARFFYCAKADRADRNDGCDGIPGRPLLWSSGAQSPGTFQSENTRRAAENNHPTVKPTDLMRWLCRLVTPAGGVVLDPFAGSGSTGRGALYEGLGSSESKWTRSMQRSLRLVFGRQVQCSMA